MHRSRTRSRGSSVLSAPFWRFAAGFLGLALLVSMDSTPRLTISEPSVPASDASCKPSPPYGVELIAAADQQWTLILSNTAESQDLVVWMWSEVDEAGTVVARQKVWSGKVATEGIERVSVHYATPAKAQRVWASLESPSQSLDLQAASMRGLAVAAGPAARAARKNNHVLTEDPESGRQVEQYVGQGGVK